MTDDEHEPDLKAQHKEFQRRQPPADESDWSEPYDGYVYDGPVLDYQGVLYE